jgi:hypothetical protein
MMTVPYGKKVYQAYPPINVRPLPTPDIAKPREERRG